MSNDDDVMRNFNVTMKICSNGFLDYDDSPLSKLFNKYPYFHLLKISIVWNRLAVFVTLSLF